MRVDRDGPLGLPQCHSVNDPRNGGGGADLKLHLGDVELKRQDAKIAKSFIVEKEDFLAPWRLCGSKPSWQVSLSEWSGGHRGRGWLEVLSFETCPRTLVPETPKPETRNPKTQIPSLQCFVLSLRLLDIHYSSMYKSAMHNASRCQANSRAEGNQS